ncbi:MAG: adenine deaminase [Methanobrevibacter sp.]|jgi:adenine deaminase|nr:adenine deaminase [Candidatus Methanovirga basalitermitum]
MKSDKLSYDPISNKLIKANILDLSINEVYPANLVIEDGVFKQVIPISNKEELDFEGILVPGFIDSHIHIESTLLTPSSFAEAVLPLGTCSVIADPHEIANVLGVKGIQFMIDDGNEVPFDFYFMAPSSVPATTFESSGAVVDEKDIANLLKKDEIIGLGEVMNFQGVINHESSIIDKLKIAKSLNKPIDGHAPKLSGDDLKKYLNWDDDLETCFISTCHESSSFDEATQKKNLGMKIMVREGSSAKNMEDLLISTHPIFDFLVTDDISPEDLIKGHLNLLVRKAIELGVDEYEAIKMVTLNPAKHYNLNSGLIAKDKIANFILVDNLIDLNVKKTFVHGKLVAENGKILFKINKSKIINNFHLTEKKPEDFEINISSTGLDSVEVNVIEVLDGELITNKIQSRLAIENGIVKENLANDILKLAVVERYGHGNIGNGFVKGFNLKDGAIASNVAHDSHNIIVVSTNSYYMAEAVNLIRESKGGLAIVSDTKKRILKLPVGGIMTNENIGKVVEEKLELNNLTESLGVNMKSPFMTLSFLALLVTPSLKLSDKGLFDVDNFEFIDVFVKR